VGQGHSCCFPSSSLLPIFFCHMCSVLSLEPLVFKMRSKIGSPVRFILYPCIIRVVAVGLFPFLPTTNRENRNACIAKINPLRFNKRAVCIYNVTLRRVRAGIVTVEKQALLRNLSPRYPTCCAHAPFCHRWPDRLCDVFPH